MVELNPEFLQVARNGVSGSTSSVMSCNSVEVNMELADIWDVEEQLLGAPPLDGFTHCLGPSTASGAGRNSESSRSARR